MRRSAFVLALGLLFTPAFAPAVVAAEAITEEEAHAIGVDAYLYFYSLITMDLTRKQLTNEEPSPGGIGGPMNRFSNVGAFPAADMRVVVRPNFDTLYSSGQGADGRLRARYRRPLLSPAHARHVDRRIRLARMAHHWNASGELPGDASRLERRGA
jgi:hypothetical protein